MKTDSFEADLRQALARGAAEVPEEAVERLQRRPYRPRAHHRMPMAGAGIAGVAAVAAVLTLTVAQPASHQSTAPASHQSGAQAGVKLAAWTVTKQADGTVVVTIRQMIDSSGLQSELRADGVPATVNTAGNPACQSYVSIGTSKGVFVVHHSMSPLANGIDIDKSALPSGVGVEISGHKGSDFMIHLVRVSLHCTGS